MNTHGHRRIAEGTGILLLRKVFEELGSKNVNLSAFYLGNWLTDLSQLNDPVAGCMQKLTAEIGEKLRANSALLLSRYESFIHNELGHFASRFASEQKADLRQSSQEGGLITPPGARQGLDPLIANSLIIAAKKYVARLTECYTALAAALRKPARKNSEGEATGSSLTDALMSMVHFAAYSKFAHPDPLKGNPGIPYPIFDRIFKSICVQYYPHEHLDRPECKYSYGGACDADWGQEFQRRYPDKLFAKRISRGVDLTSREQSIYQFLADDIELAVALLCEVDKEWASVYLTRGTDLQGEEGFHYGLAKFGHALHAVEDFFAHSNFIEHAAMLNGEQYVKGKLYASELVERAGREKLQAHDVLQVVKSDKAATKVLKRLKRYAPDVDERETRSGWNAIEEETSVVTGYFDCHDTLVSLSHVFEELLGVGKAQQEENYNVVEQYVEKYGKDRIGEFKGPIEAILKILREETIEIKARKSLLTRLDYFSERAAANREISSQEIQKSISDDGLLKTFPAEIQLDVAKIIVILCTNKISESRFYFNIYQLIKAIVEFSEDPLGFMLEPLKSFTFNTKFVVEVIYHLLLKDTFDKARYNLKEGFNEMVGAYRIGSHSLLAKDYENEPLYAQMFNCARTLHWYIVDTMCRWSDAKWIKSASEDTTWIDWKELLGYFLRHPAAYREEQVKSYYQAEVPAHDHYVVTNSGETFKSIYDRFCRESAQGYRVYSYESLLEANLKHVDVTQLLAKDPVAGTPLDQGKIRDIVIENGVGTPIQNGSYELVQGLFVVIPFRYPAKLARIDKGVWYRDVMDLTAEQWVNFVESYRREKSQESFPVYQYHKWRYFEGISSTWRAEQQRDRFIKETARLRKRLEEAYQPRLASF
jgi:hypothetical protein